MTEKQNWLEFNDSSVNRFNFARDFEGNCFGGNNNQNAYMLIYEKRIKNPIKVVIPKQIA